MKDFIYSLEGEGKFNSFFKVAYTCDVHDNNQIHIALDTTFMIISTTFKN
jgi:hypothetical protein